MTMQELLKSIEGLTEDQIKQILDGMKTNKIYTASEENLDVRYGKLKADHETLTAQHTESQNLIKQLQEATKGQEEVQGKITEYEAQIQKLTEEAQQAKIEASLKIGLLAGGAKASDIDYLIFRLEHDSEWKPELTGSGDIKGLDDKIKGLKTQYPANFESQKEKKVDEKKLPSDPERKKTVTKEQFASMGYQARLDLKKEDPELFEKLTRKR